MLTTLEIRELVSNIIPNFQCTAADNFMLYSNVFPQYLIVNIDDSKKAGTHWVAIYKHNSYNVEYFDSYGCKVINPNTLKILHNAGYNTYKYNSVKIQSVISSQCGYYCINYLLEKYLNNSHTTNIVNLFNNSNLLHNDIILFNNILRIVQT